MSNGSGNRLGSLGSQPPSAAAAHHRLARHSQLGRAQLDEYASKVMALDEEGESFVQKIHRLFTEAGAPRKALYRYVSFAATTSSAQPHVESIALTTTMASRMATEVLGVMLLGTAVAFSYIFAHAKCCACLGALSMQQLYSEGLLLSTTQKMQQKECEIGCRWTPAQCDH